MTLYELRDVRYLYVCKTCKEQVEASMTLLEVTGDTVKEESHNLHCDFCESEAL